MCRHWFSVIALFCALFIGLASAMPADLQTDPASAPDPLVHAPTDSEGNLARDARSPGGYGFADDFYGDYSDGPDPRHLGLLHKKHKHKPIFGCRKHHGCSGGGYNHGGGGGGGSGGSYASASAGSFGSGNPHYGGGGNQAQAQSASFSVGPFTFSAAQAQSGGHGGYDRFDY